MNRATKRLDARNVIIAPELVNGGGIVLSRLGLFGVVPNAHTDVIPAAQAPDVVGHFESNNENPSVQFSRALSQRVHAMVSIERSVLLRIEIRRVIMIGPLALTHDEKLLGIFSQCSSLEFIYIS